MPFPLVSFLHGNGDQGSDNRRQIREGASVWAEPVNQERHPAFVLAPQCPPATAGADQPASPAIPREARSRRCSRCSDDVERRYRVDPDRRYITGLSGGGWGTLRALSHQPRSVCSGDTGLSGRCAFEEPRSPTA